MTNSIKFDDSLMPIPRIYGDEVNFRSIEGRICKKWEEWIIYYSMNRIWWNFNWAEFQWINGNFSFGVPSYSVHTVYCFTNFHIITLNDLNRSKTKIWWPFESLSKLSAWLLVIFRVVLETRDQKWSPQARIDG